MATTEYRNMLIQARKTAKRFIDDNCNPTDRRLWDWEDYAQEAVVRLLEVEQQRALNGNRKPYLNRIVRNCILSDLRKQTVKNLPLNVAMHKEADDNIYLAEDEKAYEELEQQCFHHGTRRGIVLGIVVSSRALSINLMKTMIQIALGCSAQAAQKHISRSHNYTLGNARDLPLTVKWDEWEHKINTVGNRKRMPDMHICEYAQIQLLKKIKCYAGAIQTTWERWHCDTASDQEFLNLLYWIKCALLVMRLPMHEDAYFPRFFGGFKYAESMTYTI
jgi:hypothetical protein